jgi:hypothetical protein
MKLFTLRRGLPLAALTAILLPAAACSDKGGDSPATGESPSAGAAEEVDSEKVPPEPSQRAGSGTLTLGDITHSFTVRVCDPSGESDDDQKQTVYGEGETEEGEPFKVFVSRNDVNDMLSHTVSLQMGDVMSGEGTVLSANRVRMNDRWNSAEGAQSGPLIEIDGTRVTATGVFRAEGGAHGDGVAGELDVDCG